MLILISYHVVIFDTVELPFELPDFSTVSVHLLAGTGPVFVELVDNQCGVPIHHEAFDTERDGYTKTMETCIVFRSVVGGQEVYPKNIT